MMRNPIDIKKILLLVCVLVSMLSLAGCEENRNLTKTIEISCERTVFSYDGNDYEITEREKLVYSIRGYEKPRIVKVTL